MITTVFNCDDSSVVERKVEPAILCFMNRQDYQHEYYERTKAQRKGTLRAQKQVNIRKAEEYLRDAKDAPCFDCGVRYPYYVMDFDHRPGEEKSKHLTKRRNMRGLTRVGIPSLKAEILKCDLVCSNCHRERTHSRCS